MDQIKSYQEKKLRDAFNVFDKGIAEMIQLNSHNIFLFFFLQKIIQVQYQKENLKTF